MEIRTRDLVCREILDCLSCDPLDHLGGGDDFVDPAEKVETLRQVPLVTELHMELLELLFARTARF